MRSYGIVFSIKWSLTVSDPKKVISQNAGFVAAENRRALADLDAAKSYRSAGNERAAKSFETRASTHIERAARAAETILNRNRNG